MWLLGTAVSAATAGYLGLLSTNRNQAYFAVMIAFYAVLLALLPSTARLVTRGRAVVLAYSISLGYGLAILGLSLYSFQHEIHIRGDTALFIQSVWWSLHGLPLFNTIEGTSHLGVHESLFLFAAVPFSAVLHPYLVLFLLEAFSLAASGIILFHIARGNLDSLSALFLLVAFLLYPAFQYPFGDFYEAVLAPPFLLLLYWAVTNRRYIVAALACVALLSVKESFAPAVTLMGVFFLVNRRRGPGAMLVVGGLVGLAAAQLLIVPYFRFSYLAFRTGSSAGPFVDSPSFSQFGTTPAQIALHIFTRPDITLATVAQIGKGPYLIELLAPYLFVFVFGSAAFVIGLSDLAITLLSNRPDATAPFLGGERFGMAIGVAASISTILTLGWLRRKSMLDQPRTQLLTSAMACITLALVPLWLNAALLKPVPGAREVPGLLQRVGPDAPVAVPYWIAARFAERPIVLTPEVDPVPIIVRCSRYVVIDRQKDNTALVKAMRGKGFIRAMSGEEFAVWRAPQAPSCSATSRPWTGRS